YIKDHRATFAYHHVATAMLSFAYYGASACGVAGGGAQRDEGPSQRDVPVRGEHHWTRPRTHLGRPADRPRLSQRQHAALLVDDCHHRRVPVVGVAVVAGSQALSPDGGLRRSRAPTGRSGHRVAVWRRLGATHLCGEMPNATLAGRRIHDSDCSPAGSDFAGDCRRWSICISSTAGDRATAGTDQRQTAVVWIDYLAAVHLTEKIPPSHHILGQPGAAILLCE